MPPEGEAPPGETPLLALLKSTEALKGLTGALVDFQREYAEGKRLARENAMGVSAKLDNLDRSVGELRLAAEQGEKAREAELKRLFALLSGERQDRQTLVSASRDDKEFIREIIREELGTRKQQTALLSQAGKALWTAGGQWIVLGATLLFVAAVMKLTGLNLADIVGMVK